LLTFDSVGVSPGPDEATFRSSDTYLATAHKCRYVRCVGAVGLWLSTLVGGYQRLPCLFPSFPFVDCRPGSGF
jgi:hypothetical protein